MYACEKACKSDAFQRMKNIPFREMGCCATTFSVFFDVSIIVKYTRQNALKRLVYQLLTTPENGCLFVVFLC